MDIEIKRAGISQIETLVQWRKTVLCEVFSIPEDEIPQELIEENKKYYERQIPSGGNISCFAYYNGEIIGCGALCLYDEMPSPDNPTGRCAYLMNIYTSPEYRGRGVGTATVKWLIDRAQELGITKIFLETTEKGKPLYQKLGFCGMEGMMKLNNRF